MKTNNNNDPKLSNEKEIVEGYESAETITWRNLLKKAKDNNYFVTIRTTGTYKGTSGKVKELNRYMAVIESEDGSVETYVKISDIKAVQLIKKWGDVMDKRVKVKKVDMKKVDQIFLYFLVYKGITSLKWSEEGGLNMVMIELTTSGFVCYTIYFQNYDVIRECGMNAIIIG